jgi:hypothetical protein
MRWAETTINKLLRSAKLSSILETAGGCCQRSGKGSKRAFEGPARIDVSEKKGVHTDSPTATFMGSCKNEEVALGARL